MQEKVEHTILTLTAVFSIFIPIADWLGLLENLSFLSNNITKITLLAIGLITASLLFQRSKLDKIDRSIDENTERIIRSLNGVEVITFVDGQSFYEYVVKRMREASKSIDDLTWGMSESEKTPSVERAYEKYVETINTISAKRGVAYREVMSFPSKENLERLTAIVGKRLPSYRLNYYLTSGAYAPPLMSFMVIDAEEVIIGFYRSRLLPAEREIRLAIRHPDVVRLFQDYYDTIWQGSRPLKDRDELTSDVLEEISR